MINPLRWETPNPRETVGRHGGTSLFLVRLIPWGRMTCVECLAQCLQ